MNDPTPTGSDSGGEEPPSADLPVAPGAPDDGAAESASPAYLGTAKYVQAAFFASGVLVAYLSGQLLAAVWNALAAWPASVRRFPQLLRVAEDERPTFTMLVGVLIALALVVSNYRKDSVRTWADAVAVELAKVHWPNREAVSNGTIVVIAAGVLATVYIGLLDRLWGFLTMLVYGA